VPPVDALREAAIERRRLGWFRAAAGVLFLAGGIAMLVFIRPDTGEAAIPLAMFTPMVLVVALVALAPLVVPPLARLWALPLARWTRVSGHLARGTVVASPRRTASLAAPILGITAIAGSMVLTFGFAADASLGAMRHGYAAPVVVTSHGKDLTEVLRDTPGVDLVDASVPVEAIVTDRGAAWAVEAAGIDPATFARARRLDASQLAGLTGNTVAVSKELSFSEGYKAGGTIGLAFTDGTQTTLKVVAVVDAAPEVVPDIILPRDLAVRHGDQIPERWFVGGVSAGELDRRLGADGDAVPVGDWITRTNDELRKGNQLGLLILLGPAGLYAALTIANTLLMGSLQRRREYVTTRLLGVTGAQVRRTVLWEAGLVAAVALTLGAAISTVVGLLIRHAMLDQFDGATTTVQWGLLAGIGIGSLAIAVVAALAPTAVLLRSTRPADAVGD
jgi:putative ABC transport system permease protein